MVQEKQLKKSLAQPGILAALGAALLFGSGTPLAKMLLADVSPWLMAALLYLGSGIGLTLYRFMRRAPSVRLPRAEWPWLAGAIFTGGVLGPGVQMLGLTRMPASGASLLLNAESVFTALLAWFVFKEDFNRRIALGMGAILAGLLVLSWPGEAKFAGVVPALCVLGACFCWAVDNNLTRKVSLTDATCIASLKGLVAGPVNLALALGLGPKWPSVSHIAGSFVVANLLTELAWFSLLSDYATLDGTHGSVLLRGPVHWCCLSIAFLHERLSSKLLIAATLMALGLWLHLTEKHSHDHVHVAMDHEHEHIHDAHHQHEHPYPVEPGTVHTHSHHHEPMTYTHEHYPDTHHRHEHE
jgi:drug/metabolite transporter (DMT)-like permease